MRILRSARKTDLPQLLRLEAQFPGDRLSRRQLSWHLGRADDRLRVADDDGELSGYSLVLRQRGAPLARLYSLVVDQAQQGRGIGRQLLDDAEVMAAAAGVRRMRLEVRADNRAAQALYAAAGYLPVGQRAAYYDDGAAAILFEKRLNGAAGP